MSNSGGVVEVESGVEDDEPSMQDREMEMEMEELADQESRERTGSFEYNGKSFRNLTIRDFDGTHFNSFEDAERFYELYSAALGFKPRRARMDKDRSGTVIRRKWVCSKQGETTLKSVNRRRPPRVKSQREKCLAAFSVNYSRELDAYYVKDFTTEHSHDLPKLLLPQSVSKKRKVDLTHAVALHKDKESISNSTANGNLPSGGFEFVDSTEELDLVHTHDINKDKEPINVSAAYENQPSGGNEFVGYNKKLDYANATAVSTAKESINTSASYHYLPAENVLVDLTKESDKTSAANECRVGPAGELVFVNSTNRSGLEQTVVHKESIATSSAYEYIVHPAGGYEFVHLMMREIYNKKDVELRESLLHGDAQVAIAFMNAKAAEDPDFFCKFRVDEKGRLGNLFWTDSCSMLDYATFGDVLIFDTTYKTNIYQRPLALFVGANNHRGTVLFGCALLVDDTIDTYKWAFRTFMGAMKDKTPISVLTDGDEWNDTVQKAVAEVFPEARHRLCSWHVEKNLAMNIKDPDVAKAFTQLLYNAITPVDWERGWQLMVETFGLQDNPWIGMMYHRRNRWAEAFFVGHFFGGMSSIRRRCQGIHGNLKIGVGQHDKLCEYLPRFDKTLRKMRSNVSMDDLHCENLKPIISSHMQPLVLQIAKIFTHDIYLLIMHQIDWERKYIVNKSTPYASGHGKVFKLTQYDLPHRCWTVNYHHKAGNVRFLCSCKLFQSDGIPCAHIFSVMKAELIMKLPDSLVLKRWTMAGNTRVGKPVNLHDLPGKGVQMVRYASLTSEINKICFPASMTEEGTEKMKGEIAKLVTLAHDQTESQTLSLLNNWIQCNQLHVGSDAHSFSGLSVGINAEQYARSLPPGDFRTYFY